jgi:hypothetical protein
MLETLLLAAVLVVPVALILGALSLAESLLALVAEHDLPVAPRSAV